MGMTAIEASHIWQRVREAYGASLLRKWSRKGPGGSNPPAVAKGICSAIIQNSRVKILLKILQAGSYAVFPKSSKEKQKYALYISGKLGKVPSSDAFRSFLVSNNELR